MLNVAAMPSRRPAMSWIWLMDSLVALSTMLDLLAMVFAIAITVASSSSSGATRLTMPRCCASCALIQSDMNNHSFALRLPSSQGCMKNSQPGAPNSSVGSRKRALSAATIRSQAQASISPPATQTPCTAAMVGLGMLRQRSHMPR
ncbi:hypothetical protein D9M72_604550 [compost metagenome]